MSRYVLVSSFWSYLFLCECIFAPQVTVDGYVFYFLFFYFKQHSYFYLIASNLESIFYSIELDIDSTISQALYNQDCGSFFHF